MTDTAPIFDQYCFYIHRLKLRSVLEYKNKLVLIAKDPQEPRIVKLSKEIHDISLNFDKFFYSSSARDLSSLNPNDVITSAETYISALIGFIGEDNLNKILHSDVENIDEVLSSKEKEQVEEEKEEKEKEQEGEESEESEKDKENEGDKTHDDDKDDHDDDDVVVEKVKELKIDNNKKPIINNIRKNLRFSWSTLAGKERVVNSSDSLLELCNVLYNLGIWYLGYSEFLMSSKSNTSDDGLDEDSRKVIYDYLLKAAGIFNLLEEKLSGSLSQDDRASQDYNDVFLRILYLQSLGQAQEVTIGRAFKNNTSSKLILSLAVETSNIYKEAKNLLSSLSGENAIECRIEKFLNFLEFKSSLYQCFSWSLLGVLQNAQYQYGDSIATGRKAKELLKQTVQLIKPAISNTLSVQSLQRPITLLTKIIDLNLERFERENKLIGYQTVPQDLKEDEMPQGTKLAKQRDFQFPTLNECWLPDLITLFNSEKKLTKSDITPVTINSTTTSPQVSSSKK